MIHKHRTEEERTYRSKRKCIPLLGFYMLTKLRCTGLTKGLVIHAIYILLLPTILFHKIIFKTYSNCLCAYLNLCYAMMFMDFNFNLINRIKSFQSLREEFYQGIQSFF